MDNTSSATFSPTSMPEYGRLDTLAQMNDSLPPVGTPGFQAYIELFEALDWSAPMTQYIMLWGTDWESQSQKNWLQQFMAHCEHAAFALPLLLLVQNDNLNKLIKDVPTEKQDIVKRQTNKVHLRTQYIQELTNNTLLDTNTTLAILTFLNDWQERRCMRLDLASHAHHFLETQKLFETPPSPQNHDTMLRRIANRRYMDNNEALFKELVGLAKNEWTLPSHFDLPSMEGSPS